jgi:hypothetical protein
VPPWLAKPEAFQGGLYGKILSLGMADRDDTVSSMESEGNQDAPVGKTSIFQRLSRSATKAGLNVTPGDGDIKSVEVLHSLPIFVA